MRTCFGLFVFGGGGGGGDSYAQIQTIQIILIHWDLRIQYVNAPLMLWLILICV